MPTTEKQQLKSLYLDIQDAVQQIKLSPVQQNLMDLKTCINKMFTDSNCTNVTYTPNIDKLFFGLYVFPKVTGDDLVDIIFKGKRYIVKDYSVELDSKLFSPDLMLSPEEITALLIHDISHLVNNSSPAENVKKAIDSYLVEKNDVLKLSPSVHYRGILAFGFADAMRKSTTIFEKDHYTGDDITDEFIDWCNFSELVTNAFNKITRMGYNYNREVKNKYIALAWILRLYKDIKHNRIPYIMAIKRCIQLSPSKTEIHELKNLATRISRIDDDMLIEEEVSYQDSKVKDSIIESVKMRGRSATSYTSSLLEAMDDDYYALMIQSEKDAVNNPNVIPDLINCINSKMSVIQNAVDDVPLTKPEFNQWNDMYKKFGIMRHDLYNGNLYHHERGLLNIVAAADEV